MLCDKDKARIFLLAQVRHRTTTIQSCTKRLQASFVLVLLVCAVAHGQQQIKIDGVVSDPAGASIAQASVEFETSTGVLRTRTDERGAFAFSTETATGTLVVQAAGFSTFKLKLDAPHGGPLQIRLEPAALLERIVITADDERIPATPTSEYGVGRSQPD